MTQRRCAAARSTRACHRSVSRSTPPLIASWSMPFLLCRVGHRIGQGSPKVNAAKCNPAMRRSLRLEIHRYAVDAVAQSGRGRPVREDMPEKAAAAAAMHLGADHAVGAVV